MDTRVFIADCPSYDPQMVEEGIKRCLAAFGGAEGIFKESCPGRDPKECVIALKPNLILPKNPDRHATTHPQVVKVVAREFKSLGGKVILAESSGGPYNSLLLKNLYRVCKMDKVAEETGIELNFDSSSKTVSYHKGVAMKKIPMITPLAEADLIISLPKAKTHTLALYSGAVKNQFGAVPGLTKGVYHTKFPEVEDFFDMIIDINECVAPGFAIMDGIIGMEGQGPSGGTPRKLGVLLGAFNLHALDWVTSSLMGLEPEEIPSLRNAVKRGFLPPGGATELLGDDFDSFKTSFIPALDKRQQLSAKMRPLPTIIDEKCIGCGECVRACPQQIVKIIDNKAEIGYKKCIKCYCCQEMCPEAAIKL